MMLQVHGPIQQRPDNRSLTASIKRHNSWHAHILDFDLGQARLGGTGSAFWIISVSRA